METTFLGDEGVVYVARFIHMRSRKVYSVSGVS